MFWLKLRKLFFSYELLTKGTGGALIKGHISGLSLCRFKAFKMGTNEIVTFDVYIQSNNCSLNLPISKNENSNPLDKVIKV